uniref:serine--tRNA ligase n=1 Tax=Romanomermis culicivorax TaxID=13658 RepID=A0A915J4R8_ROMCU
MNLASVILKSKFTSSIRKNLSNNRQFNRRKFANSSSNLLFSRNVVRPDFDFDFLLDSKNREEIEKNIRNRKQIGDIDKLNQLWLEIQSIFKDRTCFDDEEDHSSRNEQKVADLQRLWNEFYEQAWAIPNKTSPLSPIGDETQARLVKTHGSKNEAQKWPPKLAEEIFQAHGTLRQDFSTECGDKSYAFFSSAAILEQCLIEYAVDLLKSKNFRPLIIPDILNLRSPRQCGMVTKISVNDENLSTSNDLEDHRRLVYTLKHNTDYCLAGTGETGIASMLENAIYSTEELPLKFYTVSRCFRPEVGTAGEEKRIYRVHEFTKVEMFSVTADESGTESDDMLQHFVDVQEEIFSSLNLHYRLLDMPTRELGASAYRKFDIEAWMPGRNVYGEISSASNCTDFQSRRLNAKYKTVDGRYKYLHTINGTACATNRLIISLVEQNQTFNKNVNLPEKLQIYVDNYEKTADLRTKLRFRKVFDRCSFS